VRKLKNTVDPLGKGSFGSVMGKLLLKIKLSYFNSG
jgi:hypothetical protein